jgi:hypothetical protein
MHDHQVQFYEQDVFLIESLSDLIGRRLEDDEQACIVIATPAHRADLEPRLRLRCGAWSWEAALRSDRYIPLDADETMMKFMVDGWPDRDRFSGMVHDLLGRASRNGTRQVLAFGEMVALLWARGNQEAAVHLERLWDDLVCTESFSLLCAYPIQGFNCAEKMPLFQEVCRAHSRVDLTDGQRRRRKSAPR